MSEENVAAVRRVYDGINAGDLDVVLAECADNVRYVNPDYAADPGTREGKADFRAALERLGDSFEGYHCEIRQIRALGDQVGVVQKATGRGRGSGAPFEAVHGHLFTFRNGRLRTFEWFRTPDELWKRFDPSEFGNGSQSGDEGGDLER